MPVGLQVVTRPFAGMTARRAHEPMLLVAVMDPVPLLTVAMPRTGSKKIVPVDGAKDAGLPEVICAVLIWVSPLPIVEDPVWVQLVLAEAVIAVPESAWIT